MNDKFCGALFYP